MTDLTNVTVPPKHMSQFERMFRLWLAGFGMSSEQCDIICNNRRIAMSIRTQDNGGIVQDLRGCLLGTTLTQELYAALNDPGEMLLLMMALQQR